MIYRYLLVLLIIGLAVLTGCEEQSKSEQIIKKELAKGIRHDSLFLGYYFGMQRQEFFDHSWSLNKKGQVTNGGSNLSIRYELDGLNYPAHMNFYPSFHNNKIYQMPVIVMYNAWAPWNKKLWSDSLQQDVLSLLESWYGEGFVPLEGSGEDYTYLKVDGNRKITVRKSGDSSVRLLYTDLTVEEGIKEEENS